MRKMWKWLTSLVLLVSLLPIAPSIKASAVSMLTLPDGEYSIDTEWYRLKNGENVLSDATSLVGKTGVLSVENGQQSVTLSGVNKIVIKMEVNGEPVEIKDGKATFGIDDLTQTATVSLTYNPTPTFVHTLDYTINFTDYPIVTTWYYDGAVWPMISKFLDTIATVNVSDGKKIVTISNVSPIINDLQINGMSNDISDGKATFEVSHDFSDVTITISYSMGDFKNTHDFTVKFTNTTVPPIEDPEEGEGETTEPEDDEGENDSVIETPGQPGGDTGSSNSGGNDGEEESDKTPSESPDSNDSSDIKNPVLDPANLADGIYSIDIHILHAEKEEESKMASYIATPALLTVENGIYTMTITVIDPDGAVTNLQIDGGAGFQDMKLMSENADKGTRTYSFVVKDLTKIMNGKASVFVSMGDFTYQASYDIRYQFDVSSLNALNQVSDLDSIIDQNVNDKQDGFEVNGSNHKQENVITEGEVPTVTDSSDKETTVEENEETLEKLSFERAAETETTPVEEEPVENAKTLDTAQVGFYVMLLLASSIILAKKWKQAR